MGIMDHILIIKMSRVLTQPGNDSRSRLTPEEPEKILENLWSFKVNILKKGMKPGMTGLALSTQRFASCLWVETVENY